MHFGSLSCLFLALLGSSACAGYLDLMDAGYHPDPMGILRRPCEAGNTQLIRTLMARPEVVRILGGPAEIAAWAARHGCPEAARAVVDGIADKQAALIEACKAGHVVLVDSLCQLPSVDPTAGGKYTALAAAIQNGRLKLLRYMQTCPRSAEFIQPGSRRPVFLAMQKGKLEALVILMERDQESHGKLSGEGMAIKITDLAPAAARAAMAGDLQALSANIPIIHSMDEIDVLLGLARRHPDVVDYLKGRQQDYLQTHLPNLQHILDVVEGERTLLALLKKLEAKESYNFLIGRQLQALVAFLAEIKRSSHRLNAEELAWMLGGHLENGFKRIDD